jgi:cell division protein FtsB
MQRASDELCREYGLSVIEEPQYGKSKHYAEWRAEREGQPTYRGIVREAIDRAIRESMTEKQLWDNLYKQGWRIKFGQDITVKPPGKERGLKLRRNFGDEYSIENIRKRILSQSRPARPVIPPPTARPTKTYAQQNMTHKTTGLRALYFYYLYKMGVLPKKRRPNPNQVYFLYREDIRKMQNIARETRLLAKHGIDTVEQLSAHKDGLNSEIVRLTTTRKKLRNRVRVSKDSTDVEALKADIATLSKRLTELRREVKLCEDIETRSVTMREKIAREAEEKSKAKEVTTHEPLGRRR